MMPVPDILFSFKGRLRRRDWWLWSIVAALVYLAANWVCGVLFLGSGGAILLNTGYRMNWALALEIAMVLPLVFANSALAAKRAQDRNMTAWPFIAIVIVNALTSFLPQIDQAVTAMQNGQQWQVAFLVLNGLSLLASIYSLIVLGFMDGTPGPNRFGRSPKGLGGDPTDATVQVFD
jgi:uncharacterized membrane protein YhaH (DUF805 family)